MCFSAHASFSTAGTLAIIGLATIKIAVPNKKLLPLATSPIFFALQQMCEGFVWITLSEGDNSSMLHQIGVYGFLFFASAWWPIWIPYSTYYAEHRSYTKKMLKIITFIGIGTSLFLFISWPLYTTGAIIINHHIDYPVVNYPFNITNYYFASGISYLFAFTYCIATTVPFCLSSIINAKLIGISLSIGLITSYIFYHVAFPSVWCFFAAISSIGLLFVIQKQMKNIT